MTSRARAAHRCMSTDFSPPSWRSMRKSLRGSHSAGASLPPFPSLVGLAGLVSLVGLDITVGPSSRIHRRSLRRLLRSVTKSTPAQSIAPAAGSESAMASTARKSGMRVDSLDM